MHSDSTKRRSFLAILFAAGDVKRWVGRTQEMNGCRAMAWMLMIAPIVLLAVLFALSWRAGLAGTGFVLGVTGAYFAAGFLSLPPIIGQRSGVS